MVYFKPQREFYIPKGATKVTDKKSDAVVYVFTTAKGFPAGVAFHGKAQKPDWRFSFRDQAHLEKRVTEHFAWRQAKADAEKERRANDAKPHSIEVGHIFEDSWGYEQTNVDFYQVTRVIGPRTVEVRQIGRDLIEATGSMSGRCMPKLNAFTGEPMVKRVTRGRITTNTRGGAGLWDGKPCYVSWYH